MMNLWECMAFSFSGQKDYEQLKRKLGNWATGALVLQERMRWVLPISVGQLLIFPGPDPALALSGGLIFLGMVIRSFIFLLDRMR